MARRPTEPTANPARGAALVVVAVLIGLFLLRNGLDTSTSVESGSDGSTSTDEGTDSTDEGTDSATEDDGGETTVPLRAPTAVKVVVLNGSGVTGAAGRFSTALQTAGYQLTDPNGADATSSVTATQVLYAPGSDREAAVVATAIGAPPTVTPQPLGTAQPGVINGAEVVIVLGPDIANTPPTSTG